MIILYIVNSPNFFLSHRLPVAVAARDAGFDVHVATGVGSACQQIADLGFSHHVLPLSRSGRNPLAEFCSLWSLYKLIRDVKPDLVHLVTIKPVLYGGLVARLLGVHAVVAAISGLGTVFVGRKSRRHSFVRLGVKWLYRVALGHSNIKVIFQNPDDRSVVVGLGAVRDEQTVLVRGSGVSLAEYPMHSEPEGVPVVTLASRLLKDKGVREFVGAARILKERGVAAKFWLVGSTDPGNLTSITEADVQQWGQQGLVEVLGFRADIANLFSRSNVIVLPSYREGLPKVLVEAAACGRAVVTTDVPGCRDAVEPGKSGLLVPVCDEKALADAIQSLVEDPVRRKQMGEAGRILAEQAFSIEKVVDAHLAIYRELLCNKN